MKAVSRSEAARILNINPETLRWWEKTGKIRPRKHGVSRSDPIEYSPKTIEKAKRLIEKRRGHGR